MQRRDEADAPRPDAVFGGLDAFALDAREPDGMDELLLGCVMPDWQMEGGDFYSPQPEAQIPLSYLDDDVAAVGRDTAGGDARRPAAGKGRVATAVCAMCGRSVSTNGANFRRHEMACRRQRAPESAPAGSDGRATAPKSEPEPLLQSVPARLPFATAFPAPPVHPAPPINRRDADLLGVVRRLETSIGTLDVSARLCLRDALVSLSNKASNPQVPPTPEQEAMNRAAEYLVLRMLFLSGHQVMHTAPGTQGPFVSSLPLAAVAPLESSEEGAGNASALVAGSPAVGAVPTSAGPHMGVAGSSILTAGNAPDDGTIAASTGSVAVPRDGKSTAVPQSPFLGSNGGGAGIDDAKATLSSTAKSEDYIGDGT